MNQVVSQYDFTVIDYTTTQYGYLFTVGTTGSRPEEYRFIYMPYSRYPSVLMLDFYVARSVSYGINHDLIQAIRKDMEAEEGFIVFGDGKQSKTGLLHEQVSGDSTKDGRGHMMEFSFEAERTALIEALESDEHPMGHRPNFLKDASLDDGMTEGWRVDNDKELKIVRNLGLTRRFVQNLGKIDPSKISFRVNEFGMIADYADSADKVSEYGMVVRELVDSVRDDQPDLDMAGLYDAVEKIIGRSAETEPLLKAVMSHLRDTELSETIKAERVSRQEVEVLYQDLLGTRDIEREAMVQEATILGARVIDNHEMVVPNDMSTAFIRRFQEVKYLFIDYSRPVGTRVDEAKLALMRTMDKALRETTFSGSTTDKIIEASREFSEKAFIAELGQARRDIEEGLMIHENVLAKLKDRQYPTLLHREVRGVREIGKGQIHLHDELTEGTRVRFRYEPVLRPSDILWNPIMATRIIDKHPTVTESGIILAHRDIDTVAVIDKEFPWASRDIVEKMHLIEDLTPAQRLFVESMYIEQDKPTAKRIFVVQGTVDREMQQAYRDSTEYGFVFRDLQESSRVRKTLGYIEHERPVGKRVFTEALDVLQKYHLGVRDDKVEAYIEERFHEASTAPRNMLLPKIEEGAERNDSFGLHTNDLVASDRESERDMWLTEHVSADKEISRDTHLSFLESFGKNHTQKNMHLTEKPLEFSKGQKNMRLERVMQSIKELGRPTIYRDELLDRLAGGGWLGNKEYPGYLDEDMIVGELLQNRPAVILELMIDAVHNADAPAYLDEEFIVGVKERIDALIDSGILAGSKDGTKSGIITLNFEGVKEASEGFTSNDYPLASSVTKEGIVDLELTIADKDKRESHMVDVGFEGTKIKETLHGEIEEVLYGDDFRTRPAIIEFPDWTGTLTPDGGLYPDDPEYMGDKHERGGTTSDEYSLGSKHERGGYTSDEYSLGSKYERGGYTSDEYSLGTREEIGGQLHTEFAMGGAPRDRFGYVDEEYTLGSPFLRQMYLNDEYSTGQAKSREGYTNDEYSMGTAKSREGDISYEYSIGTSKSREGFTNDEYSIGSLKPRQGAIDIEYSLATLQLRQTFVSDDYSIGTARARDGFTNDEYTLGTSNLRQLHINDEYTIGTREAQQSILDDSSVEAVREGLIGTVSDDSIFAVTESQPAFLNTDLTAERNTKDAHLHEELTAIKLSKDAHVHETESNVVKLRFSQLDEGTLFGVKDVKDSVIELFLDGIKGGKLAEIEDTVFGNVLPKAAYDFGDETIFALKGERDSFNFGDETIFAIKGTKDSVTFDDLVGYKNVNDSYLHDNLFAIKNPKDSYLHETTESGKEKIGELEEQLVADKPQYGYLDPLLPLGGTSLKYGDVPVESVGGTGLKYGDIPIEIVGGTSLKYGDVPIEIVGGTKLKYGTIEEELTADKPQYGNLEENLLADKPQYGHLEENLVGFKNAKDSFVHDNLFAYKDGKDAFLHNNVFAFKDVKDAEIEGTIFAGKGERDSYLEDSLFARKGGREAHLHETIDDVLKMRNASIDEDLLFGGKGLRDSVLETELVGIQYKQVEMIEGVFAHKGIREGYMHEGESNVVKIRNANLDEEAFFAGKGDRSAHLHEIEGNVVKERHGDIGEDLYGHSLQRLGYSDDELSYGSKDVDGGFVVGDGETIGRKLMDAGYTSDEYSLATHQSRAGYTEDDYSLAHKEERESFVERQLPVGTANARLSEIEDLESLMATFEERCSQVITGFIFAERPEARAEYLEQLHAFLPERTAHLMEIYHVAKTEPRDSFLQTDEHLAFRDQPSEAYLPIMDTMAQGLIYDYTNDLLDQGMNPEDWEGGFGVPEDYDPEDPFNVYYPYSKDMDALELSQTDDWIEFGDGEWERDKLIGKFYSKSDIPTVGGWYRNNFLADKYKFSIDFKVDTEGDADGAGIIFKYYDENNYWMFMVHGGDADNSLGMRRPMQLFKVVGGTPTAIGSPMQPFKWEKDKWYTLSVSVMDGRIQIYTDYKLQYDLTGTD
ncbi:MULTISPECIES: hypothetical protein [unclassified Paenibacillus]|uniref:hypothetical protein n=1 Tax=unclassified Paenibacillus TaxID=185978 RepID=UPI00089D0BCA|nr:MULTISPECIES: hypothetical protein [unclassified Paenibacillus]OMC68642.1 hypothetical protein BK126_12500 [Paenibacillus sp. FSL H7-0326]SDW56386.1 hypothetical protein SAMN05518848_102193 [Paenibacillus sp. PDC88]